MTTRRKLLLLVASILFVAALVSFVALVIDGTAYDKWRRANNLKILLREWQADGSPEPPQVRYANFSNTVSTYTASHVIDGRMFQGIFAESSCSPRYVITRNGEVL